MGRRATVGYVSDAIEPINSVQAFKSPTIYNVFILILLLLSMDRYIEFNKDELSKVLIKS